MKPSFKVQLRAWLLRHPRLTLALFALAVFTLIYPGDFNTIDTARRLQVTHWIWSNAPQVAPDDPDPDYFLPGEHGQFYAPYGIGQSILLLPGDILTHAVDKALAPYLAPANAVKVYWYLEGYLTFSWVSVINTLLSFELLVLIGFSAQNALKATLLFVLSSSFLVFMQTSQENSLMYLCFTGALAAGMHAISRERPSYLCLAGALAGWSLLIKISDLAYVPPLYIVFTWLEALASAARQNDVGNVRNVIVAGLKVGVLFGVPVLAGLAIDRLYEFYRFGDWLQTYVAHEHERAAANFPPGYPFGYPIIKGFLGPFITPEKSIFIIDPILVFLVAGLVFLHRQLSLRAKLVLGASAITLVTLAFGFGTTYKWGGDAAWGPRHELPTVEVLCLVSFGLAVSSLGRLRPIIKALVIINVVLALSVQFIALPKSYDLEVNQNSLGDPLRVVPLMRVRNLYHVWKGDFAALNLGYGDRATERMATVATENRLFVFRLGPYVPPKVQDTMIALWVALLSLTAAAVGLILFDFGRNASGLYGSALRLKSDQ